MPNYKLVFDEVILSQLKKSGKNKQIRDILSDMLNKIEDLGPRAGQLLDSGVFIYEIKSKRPPIRLYYKHLKATNEIYLFEYEMKTSEEKQKRTIFNLRNKIRRLFH
jgi:mRNA-degrading endonuclease RelE of RelBE toxin-antitoxin system